MLTVFIAFLKALICCDEGLMLKTLAVFNIPSSILHEVQSLICPHMQTYAISYRLMIVVYKRHC